MSNSIPQVFHCECDRCGGLTSTTSPDLGGGVYCPKCQARIERDNATPVLDVRATLDEIGRNKLAAFWALRGEK